ncbi:a3af2026-0b6f-4db4-8d16-cf8c3c2998ef [Sclerotinia trifoliorum]|uniref:A3af2026-0b6f-4db4-8d16-cf8c3c2998ef n=1 Tax=Sclerotinia trifoliorum TaxID=28548 RepID=A0A8H2VKG2_9HELO|nr:a3af2026-0b6f-4db4-8d16-cf8c3c2998ef [Sclerotinia trifoliorum]
MGSQSKNLSSENPKNEDHEDKISSNLPLDSSLVASHSSRDQNIFPQFNELPRELQAVIFEWSLPHPYILHFNFEAITPNEDEMLSGVYPKISKFPGNFSLLETCKISRDTVYREFKKIELFPLKTGSAVLSNRLNSRENLSYSYMRPSVDIFMCSALQMTNLYEYGGSIGSIFSLTHIAIHGMGTWFPDEQRDEDLNEFLCGTFTTIKKNCQALEKFDLVIGDVGNWDDIEGAKIVESATVSRLVEIDEDFEDLHFMASPSKFQPLINHSEDPKQEINEVIDEAKWAMKEFKQHVKHQQTLDPAAAEYWRKVNVVPSVLGWVEDQEGSEPRLWFPAMGFTIPCHEDGSPVHKYKGLAQTFDGAS